MTEPFLIKEALQFGWEKMRTHSGVLFGAVLTLFALQVAYALVARVLEASLIGVMASVVLTIASVVVGIGLTVIALKIAKGEHTRYVDIIPQTRVFIDYFLASLLAGLITMLGFVLLIIPGIYLALRYSMVRFAAIEGSGIRGSLTKSSEVTDGVKWKLLGFFVVIIAINLLGVLALGVGLLLTVPVTLLAHAHVYLKLKNRA